MSDLVVDLWPYFDLPRRPITITLCRNHKFRADDLVAFVDGGGRFYNPGYRCHVVGSVDVKYLRYLMTPGGKVRNG